MEDVKPDVEIPETPVEEVTPNPEEALKPEPPEKPEGISALESTVQELAAKVDALTEQVSASVVAPGEPGELPSEPNDDTPVRKPWTHRGFLK